MWVSEQLSVEQRNRRDEVRASIREMLEMDAQQWDIAQRMPSQILTECSDAGFFGSMLPEKYGGLEWGALSYGFLNEAIGAHSVSLTGIINVHTMVCQSLLKWGTNEQKEIWLPKLASGAVLAAFALSESTAGSDIEAIRTEFTEDGDDLLISGEKTWITFGDRANLLLVIGKLNGASTAVLVERDRPGLRTTGHKDMIGFRAAHLGRLMFEECRVPKKNILGRPGLATNFIAPYALDLGRLNITFAALGMLRACVEVSSTHSLKREAFGQKLIAHGTISAIITELGVDYAACEAISVSCALARDNRALNTIEATMAAKYLVTRTASKQIPNAIQVLGAKGCQETSPLARFIGDAKTMEIIEGSSQIHQMILGPRIAALHLQRQESNSQVELTRKSAANGRQALSSVERKP